jgi:prolyl-tRNA editing enzyme YbaK/EbsC (Cys-tRNA(Pro) deacylase)
MDAIYVSAGKRGQEIRIVPDAFSALLDASFVTLTKYD